MTESTDVFNAGAVCFGAVIGYITYRTIKHQDTTSISDIAAVVGAVGGAAVLGIFDRGDSFGYYAIGLAGGFVLFLVISILLGQARTDIMGD
jgi:hypothetical protein